VVVQHTTEIQLEHLVRAVVVVAVEPEQPEPLDKGLREEPAVAAGISHREAVAVQVEQEQQEQQEEQEVSEQPHTAPISWPLDMERHLQPLLRVRSRVEWHISPVVAVVA
jgi:hypothetical protein